MEHALAALTFGLIAGLKPGPLGIFIIDHTLRNGPVNGFRASLAPFITDGPIIALALLLSLGMREQEFLISLISIAGGIYIAYLAVKILKTKKEIVLDATSSGTSGLFTSVKINLLNPSPYLFWLTIGGSYIASGTNIEAFLFIVLALSTLCLTKFSVAMLVYSLGQRLNMRVYTMLLKALSIPLLYFSANLILEGLTQVGS